MPEIEEHGSPPRTASPSGRRGRSVSPEKAKPLIDAQNPIYIKAMEKLSTASFKFNKERNGIWLGTIENRELDPELFRGSLRSAMNLQLSKEEFDTLMPHWYNNGFVNGCDFILLFYRLRFEYKSKLLTERIAKEKAFKQKDAEFLEARRKEIEGKIVTRVSYAFSPEDKESALEKVRVAAWKFDKQGNGAPNLDAFDCEFLTPEAFKEVLRRTFNLSFTPTELGAFLSIVSDDPEEHKVRCASFLIYFLRLGLTERNNKLKSQWAERKRINDAAKALEAQRLAEQEAKNKQKVTSFQEEDKIRALSKLRLAAKNYDPISGMSMKSFEVAAMAPHEFKEQLKRVFNLQLSPPELGAIISIFDQDGSGAVPCNDFAKTFLAMGFAERAARDKHNIIRQRETEAARIEEEKEKLLAQEIKFKTIKLPTGQGFSPADVDSMNLKLREAAMWFEKGAPGSPNLDAFQARTIPTVIFNHQLKTAFKLVLSPIELLALLTTYELLESIPEGDAETGKTGDVICDKFMKMFQRLGFEERYAKERRWRELQRANTTKELEEQAAKLEAQEKKILLSVSGYTKADFDNAMQKLTIAAIHYHKSPSDILDAFEAEALPPHVFKEQLKLAFNIKVNMPELGALVAYFDPENTGAVNSKHFLNSFLRLGYEERDKIRQGWRDEERRKAARDADERAAKEELKAAKQLAEVDFEFTEDDFDAALWKFVSLCHAFEPRQLGPAGWQAFSCKCFTPPEFREVIKRTYDVRLSAKELGALITYFQIKVTHDISEKTVNSQFFLQNFVQGRTTTEAFKGKSDESQQLEEYHAKLKEDYKVRKEKMGGNLDDMRPWRTTVHMRKHANGTMSMVTKRPYPASPEEKIARRLAAGKASGRMDLSTRSATAQKEPETDPAAQARTSPGPKKGKRKNSSHQQAQAAKKEGNSLAAKGARIQAQAYADAQRALAAENPAIHAEFRLLSIPKEIFNMTSLTELWLCGNRLGAIPADIGRLKGLKLLSLALNELNTLPDEVCELLCLTRLILRRNTLSVLPAAFSKLQQLGEVDISSNQFKVFPEVLCSCPALVTIRAGSNLLTSLPNSLMKLKSLSLLSLEGNPITAPPTVFSRMSWLDVVGTVLPVTERSAYRFKITPEDEAELEGLLKSKGKGRLRREMRLKAVAPGRILGAKEKDK